MLTAVLEQENADAALLPQSVLPKIVGMQLGILTQSVEGKDDKEKVHP